MEALGLFACRSKTGKAVQATLTGCGWYSSWASQHHRDGSEQMSQSGWCLNASEWLRDMRSSNPSSECFLHDRAKSAHTHWQLVKARLGPGFAGCPVPVMWIFHSRGDFGFCHQDHWPGSCCAMPGEQQGPNHTLGKFSRNRVLWLC